MKISLKWLKEFLPKLEMKSPEDFARRMTDTGIEVESYETIANDTVFEVSIPANRGDPLSHWGFAREVAVVYGLKISLPKLKKIKGTFKNPVSVKIQDKKLCLRYASRLIKNVKVTSSPSFVKERLEALGLRSVNNVVDATNWVMLELGHPVHAFDYRFILNQQIFIKQVGQAKEFETIDHQKQKLSTTDLVIADGEKDIALAGIMGGVNSEVRADTTNVVLEVAAFEPVKIRETARRLGLHTDSSHRFERFVDAATVPLALDRLTQLIVDWAQADLVSEITDCSSVKAKKTVIPLRLSRVEQVLGATIPSSKIESLLKRLECQIQKSKTVLKVSVPSYRSDLSREIDLIEEIIRFYGINNLKSVPVGHRKETLYQSPLSKNESAIRDFFTKYGFYETIHYSFGDPRDLEAFGFEGTSLENPLSADLSALRPSLLPSLVKALDKNDKALSDGIKLFELRTVFQKGVEGKCLAGIYAGNISSQSWNVKNQNVDLFYGKGLIEAFLTQQKISYAWSQSAQVPSYAHPVLNLDCVVDGKVIGTLAQFHPKTLSSYKISYPVFYFEIDAQILAEKMGKAQPKFVPLSAYPTIQRDMALMADASISHRQILEEIAHHKTSWLKSVRLFDLYAGDKIEKGKKSMAYRLVYENSDRTLTDEEVNKVHFELVDYLKVKLGVNLRG